MTESIRVALTKFQSQKKRRSSFVIQFQFVLIPPRERLAGEGEELFECDNEGACLAKYTCLLLCQCCGRLSPLPETSSLRAWSSLLSCTLDRRWRLFMRKPCASHVLVQSAGLGGIRLCPSQQARQRETSTPDVWPCDVEV